MNSLRQNLQAHRTAEFAASCVAADERQSALIVAIWRGESWVLPWSQFVSARFSGDQIELTFANVAVVLTGEHLAGLLNDIASFRLSCLRDLPADYQQKSIEGQPFINRIEIKSPRPESTISPG